MVPEESLGSALPRSVSRGVAVAHLVRLQPVAPVHQQLDDRIVLSLASSGKDLGVWQGIPSQKRFLVAVRQLQKLLQHSGGLPLHGEGE